jgi:hypothetical protein
MQARWIMLFLGTLTLCGCSGGGVDADPTAANQAGAIGNGNVQVAWTANREAGVNAPGGGYRVYYSTTPGFAIDTANLEEVPYTSGAAAPTRIALPLASGTYFIKVVAYTALNPSGSEPSEEVSLIVPAGANVATGTVHE